MSDLIAPAVAAAYLIAIPAFINADGFVNRVAFRVTPVFVGGALALQTYARYKGWPI